MSKKELLLEIRDLHAEVAGKQILKGLTLELPVGEVHAIMGPNGSGKSTLAAVLTGREQFRVTQGEVRFRGRDLLEMEPEIRAREGVFLSFQYPIEIPGISTAYFLKSAVNAVRKHRGGQELDAIDFLKVSKEKAKIVGMDESFLSRSLNEGFSGGEKKRNEIFQMLMLEPALAVLDETDSGRRERAAFPRAIDARHHPLPAAARLRRSRSHSRARRRQDRPLGRPRAGARGRREGLHVDRRTRGLRGQWE
jgi:Fe-S cluster assembly ATP-binding protein